MPVNPTYEKSALVQAWFYQVTGHYLSKCWPRSLSHMASLGHSALIVSQILTAHPWGWDMGCLLWMLYIFGIDICLASVITVLHLILYYCAKVPNLSNVTHGSESSHNSFITINCIWGRHVDNIWLWFGTGQLCPYISGLLRWYSDNHNIALVLMKWPCVRYGTIMYLDPSGTMTETQQILNCVTNATGFTAPCDITHNHNFQRDSAAIFYFPNWTKKKSWCFPRPSEIYHVYMVTFVNKWKS